MSAARREQLVRLLSESGGWMSAADLADRLGVTSRSVRNYVAELKALDDTVIQSSADGYRLDQDAYRAARSRPQSTLADTDRGGPSHRVHQLVHKLAGAANGIDVFEAAEDAHISESTMESDLGRLRATLDGTRLALIRTGSLVRLEGPESEVRRLLSGMFRAELNDNPVDIATLQREFSAGDLSSFKDALVGRLDKLGYFVNEYGIADVLLHVTITLERVASEHSAVSAAAAREATETATDLPLGALPDVIGELVLAHFGLELGRGELDDLAFLLRSRVLTTRAERPSDLPAENYVAPSDVERVRAIVVRASEEYLVALDDDGFIGRLSVHVRNLVTRARHQSFSHNPLARSIKTSYPMTYELAVFIASELSAEYEIAVTDDEIAYIAMHIGALLVQQNRQTELVTCSIVCPSYYDMHELLRNRIEREFADDLHVVSISARSDPDWSSLEGEIVLSTVPPPSPDDRIVVIRPFPTSADLERIRVAVTRARRLRRRAAVRDVLLEYFDPRLFLRDVAFTDPFAAIEALGARMVSVGVIDAGYVAGAIARERMSSTAFTDMLAVPHAMTMTARRTSIAILLNDQAMPWGESRVNVVALIAFSESGRQQFQAVFDQFVDVFSERDAVLTLIRRGDTFESFIDELARMMHT